MKRNSYLTNDSLIINKLAPTIFVSDHHDYEDNNFDNDSFTNIKN